MNDKKRKLIDILSDKNAIQDDIDKETMNYLLTNGKRKHYCPIYFLPSIESQESSNCDVLVN